MNKDKLQRCADCDGKPTVSTTDYIYISCSHCDALIEIPHLSYEAAYGYWNRIQNQKLERES